MHCFTVFFKYIYIFYFYFSTENLGGPERGPERGPEGGPEGGSRKGGPRFVYTQWRKANTVNNGVLFCFIPIVRIVFK